MTQDDINRRVQEYRQKALEQFPLRLIGTTGDKALEKWTELKSGGAGSPVVLGGDDKSLSFDNLLMPFGPNGPNLPPPLSVDEILRAASLIKFPADLAERRKADSEIAIREFTIKLAANPKIQLPQVTETKDGKTRTFSREETIADMERRPHDSPLGEWPAAPEPSAGLSVAHDLLTGKPLPKVYIGVAPTDDWTTIPAYLRWGDWSDCPAAEYHVAAMRIWRDRYGAELVGMSFDTINLRVATRPKTREEALALARDQYTYCSDIIDQGFHTVSALAATLMEDDWWYFWWD